MSQDPITYPLPFLVRDHLRFEGAAAFDLLVQTQSDSGNTIDVTGMTREGPFRFTFVPTLANVVQTRVFKIPDIPITVSVRIIEPGAIANVVACLVYLQINSTPVALLCQGSLSSAYGINYPHQVPLSPLQQRGEPGFNLSADPAAGVEWSITVPNTQYWLLKSIRASLVAAAVAANRRVKVNILDLDGEEINILTPATQIISQTTVYNFFVGAAQIDDQISLYQQAPLPNELLLRPGTIISSVTANLNAGDNWGRAFLLYEIFYAGDIT